MGAVLAFVAALALEPKHELVCEIKDKAVQESSGLAASARHPGELYTVNDSGSQPVIYRFDLKGRIRNKVRLTGTQNVDWEDLAQARGQLFVADIGDNLARRKSIEIAQVSERDAERAEARPKLYSLTYPDGPRNAEAFAVDPMSGDFWIVEKVNGKSGVYWAAAPRPGKVELSRVGTVTLGSIIPGSRLVTGMCFSGDGKDVFVRTYFGLWRFPVPKRRTEWWRGPSTRLTIEPERQGEAVCTSLDGETVFTSSEGSPCPIRSLPRPRSVQ